MAASEMSTKLSEAVCNSESWIFLFSVCVNYQRDSDVRRFANLTRSMPLTLHEVRKQVKSRENAKQCKISSFLRA